MKYLIKITIIILILDHIWISNYMGKIFSKLVKKITNKKMKVNLNAAILSYTCMILGLRYLGFPLVKKETLLYDSFIYGTLLGLLSFGVFDFTNKAVFQNYTWKVVFIDIAWGVFLNIVTLYLSKII